jgi:hypothetical protein
MDQIIELIRKRETIKALKKSPAGYAGLLWFSIIILIQVEQFARCLFVADP